MYNLTNFISEGKPSGSLSSFALFRFMRYDAIATNKLRKLNFRGFFIMYLPISQQQGYKGFFNNGVLLRLVC